MYLRFYKGCIQSCVCEDAGSMGYILFVGVCVRLGSCHHKNNIWVHWECQGTLGVSRVTRFLNVARESADLTESGRLFFACIVGGRKKSAYARVFS